MFLASVPHHEEEFDRVLEGFTQISIAESEAWAHTDVEVILTHDDIAWTAGLVFSPDWYRRFIVPRYARIWKPLKERGIPVIFLSDGNFSALVDDIAAAGADGFMFEPVVPLEMMVEKFGREKVLIGNADCRILQFGTKDDIRREVRRCTDLGRRCPGFVMTVANHIPNGIPRDNIRCYFDTFHELRRR
jgi:uroporphyrinogen-III decarboxylase